MFLCGNNITKFHHSNRWQFLLNTFSLLFTVCPIGQDEPLWDNQAGFYRLDDLAIAQLYQRTEGSLNQSHLSWFTKPTPDRNGDAPYMPAVRHW